MRPLRRTITFQISGRAMDVISGSSMYEQPDLSDPLEREVAEALRYADEGVRGKGRTYTVTTTPDAATVIMEYCQTVGGMTKGSSDPDNRRDGSALLIVADRIFWKLKELAS